MQQLTMGKLRGLQQIANQHGIFTITALDHRGSLVSMLERAFDTNHVAWEAVVAEKARLMQALAPHSSAILLDPLFGVGPMISQGLLPGSVGLLLASEASDYEGTDVNRVTKLQPNWSVAAMKRLGAAAVKLLLFYHPEAPTAAQQEDLVRQVAADCRQHDIPFLLEPMTYPLEPGQKKSDAAFAARKPELVLESVRRLVPLGVDVLKAEFPTEAGYEQDEARMRHYCRELTAVAGIPWVLLSAGVDFVTFQRQVEIACEEGASGFLAGRAIWQEGMRLADAAQRDQFLNSIAVSRLRILNQIANYRGTPWTDWLTEANRPTMTADWYASYAAE